MSGTEAQSSVPPVKWHETLREMIDAVSAAFVAQGKQKPKADLDAQVAVEAIYSIFRGCNVYIPFSAGTRTALTHARIFAEFDGHNHQDLARRYEMSVQAIYRIIKKQRELNQISQGDTSE
jgi:Mor family transcriptional regulator